MRRRPADQRGSAIIEFVFVAVIVMLPLVYLIAAVATVQRNSLAVSNAARDAGRAFVTSDTPAQARARTRVAVRLALTDQGVPDDAQLRFVAARSSCDGPAVVPRLAPGAEFAVCVTRSVTLPGIPSLLAGRGIRTVGRFVVHVDDYRVVVAR